MQVPLLFKSLFGSSNQESLDNNAKVKRKDFINACKTSDIEKITSLVANPILKLKDITEGLKLASHSGSIKAVEIILTQHPDIDTQSAATLAERCSHKNMIDYFNEFIRLKPSIKFVGACKAGLIKDVKSLCADRNLDKNYIQNALVMACLNGHVEVVIFLLTRPYINPALESLLIACQNGHVEIVKLLLSDRRIKSKINKNESSLLIAASEANQPKVIKILLDLPFHLQDAIEAIEIAQERKYDEVSKALSENKEIREAHLRGDFSEALLIKSFSGACKKGNLEKIISLVANPALSSEHIEEGLIDVIKIDSLEAVEIILKQHPYINTYNAIFATQRALGEKVIKFFVKLEKEKLQFSLDFIEACKAGHLDKIKALLANPKVDPSHKANSALVSACDGGHLDVVKILLNNSRVDPSSNRPLYSACQNGHVDIVNFLLQNSKADLSYMTGPCSLFIAALDKIEVVKVLLKDLRIPLPPEDANKVINKASEEGNIEALKVLLEDPRIFSVIDYESLKYVLMPKDKEDEIRTLILRACQPYLDFNKACTTGQLEKVKELLTNPKIISSDKLNLAFNLACRHGHFEIVKFLLDYKEIPFFPSYESIQNACQQGHVEIVNLLLIDSRLDVSSIVDNALDFDQTEIIKALLQNSRFPLTPKDVNQAINKVCQDGQLEALKVLLDDARISDIMNRQNAIDAALKHKQEHIHQFLINFKSFSNK